MVERGGEKRGDLYTDESLSEIEEILPAGFTGYVELIGNGLDGAYYVVYDGGEAAPVAVRDAEDDRVARTDVDRARERASVYEVRSVPLETTAIPEPEPRAEREPETAPEPGPESGPRATDDSPARDPGDTDGTSPLAELIAERDRLRADVERLEAALDAYRSGTSRGRPVADADGGVDVSRVVGDPRSEGSSAEGSAPPGTERAADEALAGTTLLVRYDSLGAPTLARAGRDTEPEAVRANLRLAPHTDFDAADTVVFGTEFDEFLRSSAEYRFVEWVLGDLFFEIRETGNENVLSALYEAIPAIDRADLGGEIEVEYVSEGETRRGTEKFDVVFRDRMDDPLLVARLDETPEPAPVERVTDLLTAANRVGETVENLAGAVGVSGGYFEPEAIETAGEVTDGGFLSRESKKSFVKRSRRRGYHLCLVEAVGESFHLSVPEL